MESIMTNRTDNKSDNVHNNQMLHLRSLEDRGLSSKRKQMEMRSEFQAFLAQSLGLKASKNMSQLMYDPDYKFPRDCDFSGNPNWQIFLDCNAYNPSLLSFDKFKVAVMWSSLVEVMRGESPRALDHSEDSQLRIVGSAAIEENWTDKLVFALPELLTSSCYDSSGHSTEYYETRDAFINTLQRSLGALIKRNRAVETICKDLLLDTIGNIVIDTHPEHENSANGSQAIVLNII